MKMMYFDTFEAVNVGTDFTSSSQKASKLLGVTYQGFTSTSGPALVPGAISPVALKGPTSFTYSPLFIGPTESYQVSGKVVLGAAVSAKLDKTRTLFSLSSGDTYKTTYSALTIGIDKTVSFLGESAIASVVVSENYAYYEVVIDIDSGTFAVYVNNTLLFDGTHSLSKIWNVMTLSVADTGNGEVYLDDIYVLGGTSGPYTDRLGPVRALRMPLSETEIAEFIPNGVASNLQAVNKTSLSTTSYNRSPASNNKQDRFAVDVSGLPDDKDIFAVQQLLYYRKTDIGDRGLKSVITDAGAVNVDSIVLPQNVSNFAGGTPHIVEQVPGGGVLSKSSVATMEFGYEVTAS